MSISEQLERERKIKQEINRIKKLYKDLEKDKVKVVEGLITEASFMKLTLQELREDLFKNGMTEKEIISQAAEAKVKVYGLSEYYIRPMKGSGNATILMGYANLTESQIRTAVERLREAWK